MRDSYGPSGPRRFGVLGSTRPVPTEENHARQVAGRSTHQKKASNAGPSNGRRQTAPDGMSTDIGLESAGRATLSPSKRPSVTRPITASGSRNVAAPKAPPPTFQSRLNRTSNTLAPLSVRRIGSFPLPTFQESIEAAREDLRLPHSKKLPPIKIPAGWTLVPDEPPPQEWNVDPEPTKKRKPNRQGGRIPALDAFVTHIDEDDLPTAHLPVLKPFAAHGRTVKRARAPVPTQRMRAAHKRPSRRSDSGSPTDSQSSGSTRGASPQPPGIDFEEPDPLWEGESIRGRSPSWIEPNVETAPGPKTLNIPAERLTKSRSGPSQTHVPSPNIFEHPPEELVSSFGALSFADGSAHIRQLQQSIFGRPPFLGRNMRAVFEARNREAQVEAAREAGVLPTTPPHADRLPYTLGKALDEESFVQHSRRLRFLELKLVLHVEVPRSAPLPYSCVLQLRLELTLEDGTTTTSKPASKRIKVTPRELPHDGNLILDLSGIHLRTTPQWFPLKTQHARCLCTLRDFQDKTRRPTSWSLITSGQVAKTFDMAEIPVQLSAEDGRLSMVHNYAGPLEWSTLQENSRPEPQRLGTASATFTWAFVTSSRLRDLQPAERSHPIQPAMVRVDCRSLDMSWRTRQIGWQCPLCNRFGGPFSNRFFLDIHLEKHHNGFKTIIYYDDGGIPNILISPKPPERTVSVSPGVDIPMNTPSPKFRNRNQSLNELSPTGSEMSAIEVEASLTQESAPSDGEAPDETPRTPPRRAEFIDVQTTTPGVRSFLPRTQPSPVERIFIDLTRDSPPPPPIDPLGPSAVQAVMEREYTSRYRKSVFDVLDDLPLAQFGNQVWAVLAMEEEIYRREDIPIEERVIVALWGRWITLNRSLFLRNYFEGFKRFINNYRDIIHQAAGLRALRKLLMTAMAYRFVKVDDVTRLLLFYKGDPANA